MFKKLLFSCFLAYLPQLQAQNTCQVIRLVETKTADNLISNTLMKHLFEHFDYEIDRVRADSSQEAYALLSNNEADVYLSTWVPLDVESLKGYALRGKVKTLTPVLTEAKMGLSTNQFGQQAGLQRFEQIAAFGEALNHTIYVGQNDWMFAQRLQSVIDSNIYGLSDFQVKRVHDFDFNEYLSAAEKQQKPIVFFTRQPSFMGHKFATDFLQDSQHFFENYQTASNAYMSVRYDFPQQCEQAAALLSRFQLSAAQQADILTSAEGNKYQVPAAVTDFLDKHQEQVSVWLQGVESIGASKKDIAPE